MWSGKHRRSPRITELEARKTRSQQEKSQSKGKGICDVPEEDAVTGKDESYPKQKRKKVKMRHLKDLFPSTVEFQVRKKVGSSSNEEHHTNAAAMPSGTALPERRKLKKLLGVLKRRDSQKLFAKPVDPEEVKEYYDFIKEPMDFGTISAKLNEGKYRTVEEFEHDVFLVSSNAMVFNRSNTIFYRQAHAIRDLAKKLFGALKNNPEISERGFSKARLRAGKRTKTEVNILNSSDRSTIGLTSKGRSKSKKGCRGERRSEYSEVGQRGTYSLLNTFLTENESIVSTVYCSAKQLVQNKQNSIGYKESLMQFVKDLGPTAQMVAERKLQKCTEEALNPHNATSNSQLRALDQFYNVASSQKGISAAPSWKTHSCPNNIISSAIDKGKNIKIAKASSLEPRMQASKFFGSSSSSSSSVPWLSLVMPGLSQSPVISSMHGLDSNYLGGGLLQHQTMADRVSTNHGSNLEQAGQAFNWFWPTGSSQSPVIRAMHELDSNYLGGGLHQHQAMADRGSTDHGSDVEQAGQVFNWFWPTGSSQSPVIRSMHGLDSDYLGGGVHQHQSMADRGSTNHGSNLQQAGQAFNWFSPTELGPQPVFNQPFYQQQPTSFLADLIDEAEPSQWPGGDTSTSRRQQTIQLSDIDAWLSTCCD